MAVFIEEITATVIPPERSAESEREERGPGAALDKNKLRALLELQAERERRVRVS